MKCTNIISGAFIVLSGFTAVGDITLEGNYRLGESGSLAGDNRPLDSSGHGRHFGGVVGDPGFVVAAIHGGNDSTAALHFAGNPAFGGGYYGCTDEEYSLTNNFGVELWVRAQALGDTNGAFLDKRIFCGNGNAQGSFTFVLGNGRFGGLLENLSWVGGAVGSGGGVAAIAGEWIHLAMVRDSGVTTFYANGIAVGTHTGEIPSAPLKGSGFHLGVNPLALELFAGDIDELRLFTFPGGTFTPNSLNLDLRPSLSISNSGPHLELTWIGGSGFLLQTNASLANPGGWANVPGASNSPVSVLPPIAGTMFFRLLEQ